MAKIDRKDQQGTIQEFVRKAVKGPSNLQIKILEYPNLHFAHADGLMKGGMADSKVISQLDSKLVGICPECGDSYTGNWLSYVATMKESGLLSKSIGLSNASVRFGEGKCKNPICICEEILILWRPSARAPIDIFVAALDDEIAEVRKAGAKALGEIPDNQDGTYPRFARAAIPPLTNALKDKSEDVRLAAQKALEKIKIKKS